MRDWREAAKEDYEFVEGKQWSDADVRALREHGRPAITINRIKPLINLLSGYQRLNRYDIDFLPRTEDDLDLCTVRKGVTKYVCDTCDYTREESQVFLDASIGGLGWFSVGYKYDQETADGKAIVRRVDPFSVYVDADAKKPDYSDAKHIAYARWVDKSDLISVYKEHANDIMALCSSYDTAEDEHELNNEPLWFNRDNQRVRLVEMWYKLKEDKTICYLQDGSHYEQSELPPDAINMVVSIRTIPTDTVHVAVFIDTLLLEDIPSPYKHGYLPFVPLIMYRYGEDDIPSGFVRDLKDPQREINKRRVQMLHILNTTGNGGGWIEDGAMTPEQQADFKAHGSSPGYFAKVTAGALAGGKIMERQIMAPPAALIQAEQQCTADLTSISGINEALMGTDISSAASGRAIELKQKQAITHLATAFDNLRTAKKQITILLWGSQDRPGIIPQYYTADKVYRVEGVNGQQFIRVNQIVIQKDPLAGLIVKTLNNLSEGDFDIVIADTAASMTQRQAQLWGLVDAASKLGIPGNLVFDTVLDLSDIPQKDIIKQRWQQQQQAQAQQAQQQYQLELMKNQNMNQSIAYKDAPLPIQFAMAAKQGLIDPAIAKYVMRLFVENSLPALAQGMKQQEIAQAQEQAQAQAKTAQAQQQARQQGAQQQRPMTQAAVKSIMSGMAPATP